MPAMLMTLKVRLKVRKTAGEKLRRAMGCARKYSFNYRLKYLKKQYPFLVTDAPAQILQQECQLLSGAAGSIVSCHPEPAGERPENRSAGSP